MPVLAQFGAAGRGDVDVSFWRSMYKYEEISGGDSITGWITTLLPYLQHRGLGRPTVRNAFLDWGPRLGDDFDSGCRSCTASGRR